jgi:hypothetical protein
VAKYRKPAVSEYQPYLAGAKRYGAGRDMPTVGPVDPLGYRDRDAKVKAAMNLIRKRMTQKKQGKEIPQYIDPFQGVSF